MQRLSVINQTKKNTPYFYCISFTILLLSSIDISLTTSVLFTGVIPLIKDPFESKRTNIKTYMT